MDEEFQIYFVIYVVVLITSIVTVSLTTKKEIRNIRILEIKDGNSTMYEVWSGYIFKTRHKRAPYLASAINYMDELKEQNNKSKPKKRWLEKDEIFLEKI